MDGFEESRICVVNRKASLWLFRHNLVGFDTLLCTSWTYSELQLVFDTELDSITALGTVHRQ